MWHTLDTVRNKALELEKEVEKLLVENKFLKQRIEILKIEVNQAAATSVYDIPGHPRWEWKKDE